MKYAKIINGVVEDVFVPQAGFSLEDSLHRTVAAQLAPVPEEVEILWKQHQDGSFSAPPPAIPVAEV